MMQTNYTNDNDCSIDQNHQHAFDENSHEEDKQVEVASNNLLKTAVDSDHSDVSSKCVVHVQPSALSQKQKPSEDVITHSVSEKKQSDTSNDDYLAKKMLLDGPPITLSSIDGAESHNQIASKLLGQRESLMQLFMVKRQDDYMSRKPYRLFAGTWNVNGQTPPTSVADWLAQDTQPPDIYVIGFQELDLSKEAFVFSESVREGEWRSVVAKSLHAKQDYKMVRLIRLVGIMLLVFVAKKHASVVRQVEAQYVGTGLLGRMGNKGGVAVRFSLHSSTICVVNSHLAAHSDFLQRRNEDFREICTRTQFPDPDGQGNLNIFQHDIVMWVGDLNYRIDSLSPELVKDCISKGHYKLLKENDQLLCEQSKGNVFQGFEEGDITFRPTYKYDPGTDDWDSSEKCRIPAWCDRVLWREVIPNSAAQTKKHEKFVRLLAYRSHQALKISDHKPVSALFDIDIKEINQDNYRQVYEEEIRRMDKMENDWLPTVTLNTHTIDFGDVCFQTPIQRSLELHNTGQMPCRFEFIGKFEETHFCQPWLTIAKPKGFIMPDEKEKIEMEVYVNRATVSDLNIGVKKLEDILILHLVDGKDLFLTINGRYLPSCFGMPLEVLCEIKDPIRKVAQSELLALSQASQTDSSSSGMKIPKELWRILDHLFHYALKQEDLFQQPGLHSEVQAIQEELDCHLPTMTGINQLPGSNHSVVNALLVFLESLPNPVIPFSFYHPCLEVANDYPKAKALMKTLPSCHRSLFFYLIAFFQELLKYRKYNGLATSHLGNVFGGLILRPSKKKVGIDARVEKEKVQKFLEKFLINPIDDC